MVNIVYHKFTWIIWILQDINEIFGNLLKRQRNGANLEVLSARWHYTTHKAFEGKKKISTNGACAIRIVYIGDQQMWRLVV